MTMERLNTIQKRGNLNAVFRSGEKGPGGAYHEYEIVAVINDKDAHIAKIEFQKGPRNAQDARHGVLDTDLLEIVRDRLKAFQAGGYATKENGQALLHVEEALMWMNRRTEDRIERGVLGTMNK